MIGVAFDQWVLPPGEQHLQQWMSTMSRMVDGRLTYQYHKYEAAIPLCRRRSVAVDVGAHVGLWTYWMARDFGHVIAFEPHPTHRLCFHQNMLDRMNVSLYPYALGAEERRVSLETGASSSGDTRVVPGEEVQMTTLDSFELPILDFLKIDCEGYELRVLEGAIQTLRRCRPVVVVEQKPGHGERYGYEDRAAVAFLEAIGATHRTTISGDEIMTFG